MDSIKGFITSVNQYKDKNVICNLLTPNEVLSFEVLSLYGKNSYLINDIQCLNFGEFELYKGKLKYYKLKTCKVEYSLYKNTFENRELLFPFEYIKEVIKKNPPISDFDKFYKLLELTINKILENSDKTNYYILLFISFYLRFIGFSPLNVINPLIENISNKTMFSLSIDVSEKNKIYMLFELLYTSLFNDKYKVSFEKVIKIDEKYILISLKDITKIFEDLTNCKINSLNLI